MRYLGGKHRIAQRLAEAVLPYRGSGTFYEPFCGGLSATVALQPDVASDANEPLIRLWEAGRAGFTPRTHYTSEDYQSALNGDPLDPANAFLLIGGSYSGKWRGGLARNRKGEEVTDLTAYVNAFRKKVEATRGVRILHRSYTDLSPEEGDLVYCDPPYRGVTNGYATGSFDSDAFWDWCRWAARRGADVFVSEYMAPQDIATHAHFQSRTDMRKSSGDESVVEKLFRVRETEEPIPLTYPILTPEVFGRRLIQAGDLDPVYIALANVDWDERQKKRWLVAYWLFYHPGLASWASEREVTFWTDLKIAASNHEPSPLGQRWPRASERRHFRGEKAVGAVDWLRKEFPRPDIMVDFVARGAPDYGKVAAAVCSLPQFGPWLAFKVADMLDRCLDVPVDFDLAAVTMFDDPKKAALMVARRRLGLPENAKLKDEAGVIRQVVEHLIHEFRDLAAPPLNDRPIGYQEAETVLCKYKSHVNGHYPVGKDCREIREGLTEWASVSEAAREFLHWMPTGEQVEGAIPA